ncbi:MAG: ATP-binding cassette domain-containing protein [Bacteroidota bacterium]|nr:ATP-binding cassette domain-containing protein [Bacteroidota bacterium]
MSLLAKNVIKTFGSQKALDKVSFRVDTGEIVGFLGPNGAGKSTMMKIMTGYFSQDSGDVFVNGINTKDNIKGIRKQVGYLPEHNPLYTGMYIKEYLRHVAKLYGVDDDLQTLIPEIIKITGLEIEQHKKIEQLSKGYRQRTGLAAALIHDPDVLILDEPTTGLDPNQIIEIRELIQKIGKRKTVLLSTHIMQEAEALCNRIIIIDKGKIVADKKPEEISEGEGIEEKLVVEYNKAANINDLQKISGVISVTPVGGVLNINCKSGHNVREALFNYAVKNGMILHTLYKEKQSIEQIFKTVTK